MPRTWKNALYDYQQSMCAFDNPKHIPIDAGSKANDFEKEVIALAPFLRRSVYNLFGVPWRGTWIHPNLLVITVLLLISVLVVGVYVLK